jgi:ribosomal protein S27AE
MKDFYFDSGEDNDMCPKCGDGLIFESPSEENDYCSCWYCGGCEYIVKWACALAEAFSELGPEGLQIEFQKSDHERRFYLRL